MFENLLNPILGPLLSLEPIWSISILALGITLLITLAYKYLTDQVEMKDLKKKLKDYQKQIKEAQKTAPEKAMKIQKKAMQINLKYMKHSMRATIYTFIPIIIIFGWMQAHLAYAPLVPDEPFNVNVMMEEGLPGEITMSSVPELIIDEPTKSAASQVTWNAQGSAGEYTLLFTYGDRQFEKEVLITNEYRYKEPNKKLKGAVKGISIEMTSIRPLGSISLLGWKPGWLGTYILLSIALSAGLRKILDVA